jgi:hypothetical protein
MAVACSDSDIQTPAVGGARGEARWRWQRGWDGHTWREARRRHSEVERRAAIGADTRGPDSAFKARYGVWQPRGEGTLIGGPSVERGTLTGGSHVSAIFKIKFTPR